MVSRVCYIIRKMGVGDKVRGGIALTVGCDNMDRPFAFRYFTIKSLVIMGKSVWGDHISICTLTVKEI